MAIFIEIQHVGFVNKGAELMLHSIVEMVRSELPDANLVMSPGPKGDYEKRACLGLFQKMAFQKYGVHWGSMGWLIRPFFRKKFGLVTADEIDVILDASGFLYSDSWGAGATIRLASDLKRLKKRNKKFILLPQAFGPFTSPEIRTAFKEVSIMADLIFVRDEVSYKHVIELTGDRSNIRQAPDFTNLLSGIVPDGFDADNNRFCIIPNYRMIDKTSKDLRENYLPFLARCMKYLLQREAKPFILIHEGADDLSLANQVAKEAGSNVRIIRESDPRKIKGIIGNCEGVISSRFHGLVSALSQGVPALGTGWSHKYEMLFKEYGFDDGCMSVQSNSEELYRKIDLLLDPQESKMLREKLAQSSENLKKSTEGMWRDVFDYIKK
jgi:polysaccharide pyruvyl transferase WcaK-like protein